MARTMPEWSGAPVQFVVVKYWARKPDGCSAIRRTPSNAHDANSAVPARTRRRDGPVKAALNSCTVAIMVMVLTTGGDGPNNRRRGLFGDSSTQFLLGVPWRLSAFRFPWRRADSVAPRG